MLNGSSTVRRRLWSSLDTPKNYFLQIHAALSNSTLLLERFRSSLSIHRRKCLSLGPLTISTSLTYSATFKILADVAACRFIYDRLDGSFTEIPQERLQRGQDQHPYDRCPVCLMFEEQEEALVPHRIYHGIAWKGVQYHPRDIVMITAPEGPCRIGQITCISPQPSEPDDECRIRVRMFGRISELGPRPAEELKDEVRVNNPRTNFILITRVLSVISLSRKMK